MVKMLLHGDKALTFCLAISEKEFINIGSFIFYLYSHHSADAITSY